MPTLTAVIIYVSLAPSPMVNATDDGNMLATELVG
jgi:hypothetical protein